MTQPRVWGYVSRETAKDLDRYAAAHGLSKSRVVEAALRGYFDDTTDTALLFRRLDKHTRTLSRLSRDLELLSEAFAVFVRLWFAHTPRLEEAERGSAQMIAEERYGQFCAYVAEQLARGHRLVDDLAEDPPITDDELKAALDDPPA